MAPAPQRQRPYRSPLRAVQARLTSQSIVSAASALFSEQGYAAVTLDAIAEAAGVSRATVFNSVGGKPVLLRSAFRAAFGRAAGGEGVEMPLVDRPRSREVRARSTVRGYIEGYSGICASLHRHLARLYETIREGARADPDVQALWVEVNDERRRGARTIVADVKSRAALRSGLADDEAADIVWVLNAPSNYQLLVHERGWPEEKFRRWLARSLEAELLGVPKGARDKS